MYPLFSRNRTATLLLIWIWMVIFDRFFMKVRIKNFTSISFKTFMWRDIFSVSFCGETFVTLPHPFMEASVWMVIWGSCCWNSAFGELYIFSPIKELLSCQISKNYEILLTTSTLQTLHLLLEGKRKFIFAGNLAQTVDKKRRITTSNFIAKLWLRASLLTLLN